jgi:pyrroloquinoline-quinone synthase
MLSRMKPPAPPVPQPLDAEAFATRLRAVGSHYHDRHPFHERMNAGTLSPEALKTWAVNRYYYQRSIPLKDAAILSNIPEREVRRRWVQRIVDHDGDRPGTGGIEAWLRLCQAVGATREETMSEKLVLPGVRFAVDAYLTLARTRPWIEAVASSLTELFAPALMGKRLAAFETHYKWVEPEGLAYFRARLTQAKNDSDYALPLVLERAVTREQQEGCIEALERKCDILWVQLEAIEAACRGGATCATAAKPAR